MNSDPSRVFTPRQTSVIVLTSLIFLIAVGSLTLFLERLYNQQGFEEDAQALHQNISHIVSASEGVITTVAGFQQADEQLDRYELATLTQQLFETYPFISQIIKFQIVYPEEREEFESFMGLSGHYNFQIKELNNITQQLTPRANASQYAPVIHVEPSDPLISRIIGVDLFAQDTFAMTLKEAIDGNSAALMVRPQYWISEQSLSVLRPTYYGHYVPGNRAERWNQLEGGFIAVVQMDAVLKPIIESMGFSNTQITLNNLPNAAGTGTTTHIFEFSQQPLSPLANFPLFSSFKWEANLPVGERSLAVRIEHEHILSPAQLSILLVSTVITLLLILILIKTLTTRKQSQIERTRAKEAIYLERERAEVTLQSIGDAVITTDHDHRIVYLNPVAELMTGSTLSASRGMPLNEVVVLYREENGKTAHAIDHLTNTQTTQEIDYQLRGRDGSSLAVKMSISQLRNTNAEIIGNVMVLHDISTVKELTNQLSYQATHDPLTGIANRRFFEERLTKLLNLSKQNGSIHALCYVDLDQFKLVNDTCGHSAGDELLIQLTFLFKKHIRENDMLARLGGDEFGLLLENCDISLANELAQRVRSALHEYFFNYREKVFNVRASIGVVEISQRSGEIADVLSAADIACYAAKDAGRDEIHLYNPSDKTTISRRGEMHWLQHIQTALANDSFILFLQPIVTLQAGAENTHYEFLVRMVRDSGELISPGEFIPAAERYGLMKDIDHWVIEHAIKLVGQYLSASDKPVRNTQFSINLSGQSITDAEIIDHITQALHKYGVAPGYVCFEITETAAIANLAVAVELINSLRKIGCGFSLDDFGAGLSSFGYLKRLPIDYLKIDGQFVKGIIDSEFDEAMVQSMVEIGKVLNVKTVGELVENQAIADKLKEIGVDFAQGYHYGHPRRATQVLNLTGTTNSPRLKLISR